jgi:hypothetical protein
MALPFKRSRHVTIESAGFTRYARLAGKVLPHNSVPPVRPRINSGEEKFDEADQRQRAQKYQTGEKALLQCRWDTLHIKLRQNVPSLKPGFLHVA